MTVPIATVPRQTDPLISSNRSVGSLSSQRRFVVRPLVCAIPRRRVRRRMASRRLPLELPVREPGRCRDRARSGPCGSGCARWSRQPARRPVTMSLRGHSYGTELARCRRARNYPNRLLGTGSDLLMPDHASSIEDRPRQLRREPADHRETGPVRRAFAATATPGRIHRHRGTSRCRSRCPPRWRQAVRTVAAACARRTASRSVRDTRRGPQHLNAVGAGLA